MRDFRATFSQIARDVLRMYVALTNDRTVAEARQQPTLLGRRLALLQRIVDATQVPGDLTSEQSVLFQECLLDAIALQQAGGGRRDISGPITLNDPTLFGGAKERRARLMASDQAQLDWHFMVLVQAWAASHSIGPVKDLRTDSRFKKLPVCDFAVVSPAGRTELLECKRFHPGTFSDTSLKAVIAKIAGEIPHAIVQLKSAASILGAADADLHLLVDVTAYGIDSKLREQPGDFVLVGGLSADELEQIASAIGPLCGDLNQATVCWHSPLSINGRVRAIVQNARALLPATPRRLLEYTGWTVELYPLRDVENMECRISSTARTADWVLTSYRSLSSPDTFLSIGPEICVG